jgi:hypothetical protein
VKSLGEAWQNRSAVRDFVRQVTALAENVASEPHAADDDRLPDLRSVTLWCVLELGAGNLSYQAVEIGEKLVADNERVRGGTHQKTLISQENLAHAYRAAGRMSDAVPLHERALAGLEQTLGAEHPTTVMVRGGGTQAFSLAGRWRSVAAPSRAGRRHT